MTADIYQIKLDKIFEGPMDLLIHLIKKHEVDVYDIPIALITDQYLHYIELMKAMNIDLAGDFLVMAATLAQIKSKMLLPVHENEEDDEDPRTALTRPLLEYLQMKTAAEQLSQRPLLGEDTFTRKPGKSDFIAEPEEEVIKVGLFELIDAFQKVLSRISVSDRMDLAADQISVKERITEIVDILEVKGTIAFDELFCEAATKNHVIVTFLAVLEMVKLSLIRVAQHLQTGVIRLFYQ